jgi:hypothetical protein
MPKFANSYITVIILISTLLLLFVLSSPCVLLLVLDEIKLLPLDFFLFFSFLHISWIPFSLPPPSPSTLSLTIGEAHQGHLYFQLVLGCRNFSSSTSSLWSSTYFDVSQILMGSVVWHVIEFVTSKCSQVQSSKGDDGWCCFRGSRLVKEDKKEKISWHCWELSFSKTNFCSLRLGFHNTNVWWSSKEILRSYF